MLIQQIKGCIWLYKCDWCGKEFEGNIGKSRNKTNGCTRSCGSKASRATVKANLLEKHGVENVSQLPEVREKVKNTTLERFGVECSFQSEIVKQRSKNTMIERYGVETPLHIPEVRAKIAANNLLNYGVEHVWENPDIREKSKQTMIQLYGVDNPQKSPEIRAKTRNTCIEKYGVENPRQAPEIQLKIEQTCMKKYGVKNPFASKECQEKSRQTSLLRYGTEYPMQSPEIQQKIIQTLTKTGFISRSERRCLTHMQEMYGSIHHQVSINKWIIDFYIPSAGVYVQFDGVYWHGLLLTDEQRQNPKTKREIDIVKKWKKDQEQAAWFAHQSKRLVRITDSEFKSWEDHGTVKNNMKILIG